jgi:hypothetical protein
MNVVIGCFRSDFSSVWRRFAAFFRTSMASISVHSVQTDVFFAKNFREDFFDLEWFKKTTGGFAEKLCRKVLQSGVGLG